MKITRIVVTILSISLLSLWIAGCTSPEQPPPLNGPAGTNDNSEEMATSTEATNANSDSYRQAAEEPYPSEMASVSGELNYSFSSVEEMAHVAPVIAVVAIANSEYTTFRELPFTMTSAVVKEALKGPHEPGETITIVETGGMHAGRSKEVPGETGEIREVGFAGVPVMKPGEFYLVFLDGPVAEAVGAFPEGSYAVQSAFQGKVRVGSGGDLQFTGAHPAEDDLPLFAVPLSLEGRPLDDVRAEIIDMLADNE